MRTVFAGSMLAHIWANRSQAEGRTSTGNFYFAGPSLFSYGSHFVIAHHLEGGAILWNADRYSNSTAKQQSHAFRALSRVQREALLHAPSLNASKVENLERCKQSGTMPAIATECAMEVLTLVRSIANMRSADRMRFTLEQAQRYEKTGIAVCAYARKGAKKAPLWPLPALPSEVPDDKEKRREWIASVAKVSLLAEYKDYRGKYERALAQMREHLQAMQGNEGLPFYQVQNVLSAFDHNVQGTYSAANKTYRLATGRDMPRYIKEGATLAPLRAQLEQSVAGAWKAHLGEQMRDAMRAFYAERNQRQRNLDAYQMRDRLRTDSARLEGFNKGPHVFAPFVERVTRCAQWYELERTRRYIEDLIAGARRYAHDNLNPAEAALQYRQACKQFDKLIAAPAFYKLHFAALEPAFIEAGNYLAQADALIREANAQVIARWIAGASSERPPSHAGTFARIRGNEVQTSLGATVPLAHACRLARIARRIINAGGKQWERGTGPRVGHFQVNSIDASGACVIGCHEFAADEALRLLALLEGCAACADVADDEAPAHIASVASVHA